MLISFSSTPFRNASSYLTDRSSHLLPVKLVQQHQTPGDDHLLASNRLVNYLYSTKNLSLVLGGTDPIILSRAIGCPEGVLYSFDTCFVYSCEIA